MPNARSVSIEEWFSAQDRAVEAQYALLPPVRKRKLRPPAEPKELKVLRQQLAGFEESIERNRTIVFRITAFMPVLEEKVREIKEEIDAYASRSGGDFHA